jgi:hypothetical protein
MNSTWRTFLVTDEASFVPVEESLPEPYVTVLVFTDAGRIGFGALNSEENQEDSDAAGGGWEVYSFDGVVTHWAPLPHPPEEEE